MVSSSWSTMFAGVLVFATGHAKAQEVLDLLGDRHYRTQLSVSAYNPRVEPQVRCLRSVEEAAEFAQAAWGEEKEALHIDFEREQILVVAWGALRWAEKSAGWGIGIHLEKASIREGTLRVEVRTVLPAGPGIDIAAEQPGRTWYPSLFVRTPRTDRVEVDLFGARRRKPLPDFRPVATKELELRIAPDACPSRELLSFLEREETLLTKKPKIGLYERNDQQVLEVAWGRLGAGSYRLDLVGVLIDKGVARLNVRADNREIMFYSGPGVHEPGFAVQLPHVDKVLLHIERVGLALPAKESDFEAMASGKLEVTVDKSALIHER
jgi:hypothetical protein